MIRYYVSEEITALFQITDSEKIHHLKNVIKLKENEVIYIVNGIEVGEYTITSIENDEIHLHLNDKFIEDNELNIKVDIAFSALKKSNTELVIQKVVELGVNKIIVSNFERSVVKYDSKKIKSKIEKYKKIIVGAVEQSRRNITPEIEIAVDLNKINLTEYDQVYLCYENEKDYKLIEDKDKILSAKNILIIIGPEGGISDRELEYLKDKVKVVSLGKRIYRAETAAINAVSVLGAIIEGER